MTGRDFQNRSGFRPHGFYTYAYLRPEDSSAGPAGSPWYIGKGHDRRAWRIHRSKAGDWRPPSNEQILILKWGLSQEEAFEHEKYMISLFGLKKDGGILINRDLGGLGSTGAKRSPEHVAAIMKANVGRIKSPQEIEKISNALKGHQVSEETKQKISVANKGKKIAPDVVERRAAKLRGRRRSPLAVAKGAAKLRGRKKTEAHIKAMADAKQANSAARYGIPVAVWKNAPQVKKSEVPKMIRKGWTIDELVAWLQGANARINPLLQASAQKMGLPVEWWASLEQASRRTIGKRWRAGKRGSDLIEGYA